jgi:hypothetical protein
VAGVGPTDAASRCWKPHVRRLSNDLISEVAVSESLRREIEQIGEQVVGCCKTNDFRDLSHLGHSSPIGREKRHNSREGGCRFWDPIGDMLSNGPLDMR